MIRQPFNNAELQAITPASPKSERISVRGMRGYRVWNLSPWFWDMFEEGDSGRLIGHVTPWSLVQGDFEREDLTEVLIVTATDLVQQPVAAMTSWRFMVEISEDQLEFQVDQLLGNL